MSALRVDLQELRAVLTDRVREDSGEVSDAAMDGHDGVATARRPKKETLGDRIRGLLPRAARAATQPGALLRSVTSPGGLFGPRLDGIWAVDPQVPEPLGLYPYLAELDHWIAEQPLEEPFLVGLLAILKYDDAERIEYRKGRPGLWGLVPPIDAMQVADANLPRSAAAALGLGVVAWGYQGLARYLPKQSHGVPPMLQQTAEIIAVLTLVLDLGNEAATSIVSPRLFDLGTELEARGANALSALDDRRASIVEAHRLEVKARRATEGEQIEAGPGPALGTAGTASEVSLGKLLVASALLAAAVAFSILYTGRDGGVPSAASYEEVPAVAIIRLDESIVVRVDPSWMLIPVEQRAGSAVALWERFTKELDGRPIDLDLRDRKNQPLGVVHVGEVSWVEPAVPEEEEGASGEEPEAPPAP